VLTANSEGRTGADALLAGFDPALYVVTALAAIGLVIALTGVVPRRGATQGARPTEQLDEQAERKLVPAE
jgi:hypothetical protein